MRRANVANTDVAKPIHGEIEEIGILRLDDVENHSEFWRQTKLGDGLCSVGDTVSIHFDRSDQKAFPALREVVEERQPIEPKSETGCEKRRRCDHHSDVHSFGGDFAPGCVSLKQKTKTLAVEFVGVTALRTHAAKAMRTLPLRFPRGQNRSEPLRMLLSHCTQNHRSFLRVASRCCIGFVRTTLSCRENLFATAPRNLRSVGLHSPRQTGQRAQCVHF